MTPLIRIITQHMKRLSGRLKQIDRITTQDDWNDVADVAAVVAAEKLHEAGDHELVVQLHDFCRIVKINQRLLPPPDRKPKLRSDLCEICGWEEVGGMAYTLAQPEPKPVLEKAAAVERVRRSKI